MAGQTTSFVVLTSLLQSLVLELRGKHLGRVLSSDFGPDSAKFRRFRQMWAQIQGNLGPHPQNLEGALGMLIDQCSGYADYFQTFGDAYELQG